MSGPLAEYERSALERAIFEHARLPLRSDQHQDFLKYYVDDGRLQPLLSGDWQVIQGRRGTGKTILLGALHDTLNTSGSNDVALMFTAYDFQAEPVGTGLPDAARGLGYFQVFLDDLSHRLHEEVHRIFPASGFSRLFGASARKSARVEKLLREIGELSERGTPIGAFSHIESAHATTQALESSYGYGTEAEAGVDRWGVIHFNTDIKAEASRQQKARSLYETIERSPAIPRFGDVRKKLIGLLEELRINRLYLLIDEWSYLDPQGQLQPLFADLLKRTFGGTSSFSVKIAAESERLHLEASDDSRATRGLELGGDIFPAVDLDRPLNSRNKRQFFSKLLSRRLGLTDDVDMEHKIFYAEDAFTELVTAGEGIPRQFLSIFNRAAQRHSYRVEPLWTVESIRTASIEIMAEEEQRMRGSPSADLLDLIRIHVRNTGTRIFSIDREDRHLIEDRLLSLLRRRLIHDHDQFDIAPNPDKQLDLFRLDYALWLGLGLVSVKDNQPVLTSTAEAFRTVLPVSAIDS
jgi:hypothetical protein